MSEDGRVWMIRRSVCDDFGRVVASMNRYFEEAMIGQSTQLP